MNKTTVPSAPYTRRPPSPPQLPYPIFLNQPRRAGSRAEFVLTPSYDNVDPGQLTAEDLAIITQNQPQLVAPNVSGDWRYEQRREAQRILEFLYIGPHAVIRDHDFLRREGITMIVVARDSRLANRSMESVDRAGGTLGVRCQYIDVEGPRDLIHGFPQTIRDINDHLLSVYRGQMQEMDENDRLQRKSDQPVRGKVLVTCESGNELAPAIVAAYIMSVFGKDMQSALQFVGLQRFCACFDENTKRLLQSWQDILRARASVARARTPVPGQPVPEVKPKRRLDQLRDDNDDEIGLGEYTMDRERFLGRDAFVPFVDIANDNAS